MTYHTLPFYRLHLDQYKGTITNRFSEQGILCFESDHKDNAHTSIYTLEKMSLIN